MSEPSFDFGPKVLRREQKERCFSPSAKKREHQFRPQQSKQQWDKKVKATLQGIHRYLRKKLHSIAVGGLLHSRRSCKKKHLRKISTEKTPKLPSRELRHNDMP
jgi:hypothetical protein